MATALVASTNYGLGYVIRADLAIAHVQAYAIDTATGNSCPRERTLVVTPPNGFVSRTLNVSLPICGATIGSVD